jgi:hypothetical protein
MLETGGRLQHHQLMGGSGLAANSGTSHYLDGITGKTREQKGNQIKGRIYRGMGCSPVVAQNLFFDGHLLRPEMNINKVSNPTATSNLPQKTVQMLELLDNSYLLPKDY